MLSFKKGIFKYLIVAIVFFAAGYYLSKIFFSNNEQVLSRTQIVMGTVGEIKVINADGEIANKAINSAFKEIKRIENIFSTYRKGSPIWNINHSDDNKTILNDELYNFMLTADSIWRLTGGAFDPALGSLTDVWGFNSDNPSIPSKKKVKTALENSGWKNIELFEKGIIKKKNVKLDFGSIAKGYAVDKAVEILKSFGIKKALVNLGGEVKGMGKQWSVGIKHPRVTDLLLTKVKLKDYGIATSGDYEKYFFENGVRYSHIIDPETGYPSNLYQSVSVINKDVSFADALATAFFVLDKEQVLKLVNNLPETECLLIDKEGKRYESDGFKKFEY